MAKGTTLLTVIPTCHKVGSTHFTSMYCS